jgi:putative hydrolase of the HAD superfamily
MALALAAEAVLAERQANADPNHREIDLAIFLADWARRQGQLVEPARITTAVDAIGESWIGQALQPIPGAVEALLELRRRGYRIGLVSNVWLPPDYCRRELEREGFSPLLDFAVFSSEVGFRKPSPIIYEAALAAAFPQRRPADLSGVLFVGDSPPYDVAAPAAMGMKTALVDSPPDLWSSDVRSAVRPDLHLKTVADLPGLLVT